MESNNSLCVVCVPLCESRKRSQRCVHVRVHVFTARMRKIWGLREHFGLFAGCLSELAEEKGKQEEGRVPASP
jgi:hypothetical protein